MFTSGGIYGQPETEGNSILVIPIKDRFCFDCDNLTVGLPAGTETGYSLWRQLCHFVYVIDMFRKKIHVKTELRGVRC